MAKLVTNILLTFLLVQGNAQLLQSETVRCREFIKEYYRSSFDAKKGKGVSISYSSDVKLRDKNQPPMPPTLTKITSSQQRLHLQSKDVEMFEDENDIIVVLPALRQIIRKKPMSASESGIDPLYMNKYLDTIVDVSEITSCGLVSERGRTYQSVAMQVPKELIDEVGFKSMTFWFDQKTKMVSKLNIRYDENSDVESMTNTFLDFKDDIRIKKEPVISDILDAEGNLREEYTGFTIMDERND